MKSAEDIALESVYLEERSDMHDHITNIQVEKLRSSGYLEGVNVIMDVGCGMGPAWEPFRKAVKDPFIMAITPNEVEQENAMACGCRYIGPDIQFASLDHDSGSVDLIWMRHVAEHFTNPLECLLQANELLKPTGVMYVEVPAPDTCAHHENNPNHFSVLGDAMWKSLFFKAGFNTVEYGTVEIPLAIGPDRYFWYILKKKG